MTLTATEAPDSQLLTGMLDTMTDHVFLLKVEGQRYRLVFNNQAMDNFMNQPREGLRGRYLDEIILDATLYQIIAGNYQRSLEAGKVIRYEETTEGFKPLPLTVFDTRISPLTGEDGTSRYICGISRDITARRKAETALEHSNQALKLQLSEIRRLQQQLQHDAIRDPLTNLFNRRYFMESLSRELHRAQREDYPVTLMMLDIDYFKQLNDDRGHAAGDQALMAFSQMLLAQMRNEDVVCRWGGEEFLIMMPGLPLATAHTRIEAWRAHHSPMKIALVEHSVSLRFSAGLATAPEHGSSPDKLINAADIALYQAKNKGRDQLQVFQANPIPR
ncbi:MAG: sensor domain-containing diguanylate cyclase [Halomonadaceae bacterium]|nr:MAG: sensor domain-containing diguanylate cyclase [Halomonadaceae bacterium]